MKIFSKGFFLFGLVMLGWLTCVRSDDDIIDENEDDAVVNEDVPVQTEEVIEQAADEEPVVGLTASPYVTTHTIFIQPESLEFPAGKLVRLVTNMRVSGSPGSLMVDSIESSLRYPQDYQYAIQNFSTIAIGKEVENDREATFEYSFTPHEVFAGRPFGLIINLNMRNHEGKLYSSLLFNNTINVVDNDEGLDGETFFLYIFLVAIVGLLAIVGHHYFSSAIRKRVAPRSQGNGKNAVVSNGQQEQVDMDWIPREHLQTTPRTSPRLRQRQKIDEPATTTTEAQ